MTPNQQPEAAAMQVYEAYWDSYLKGDLKTMAAFLDEDIKVIGSTEAEVFFNKKEALNFYEPTADQIAGKAELRNRVIKAEPIDGLMLITEQADFYVLIDGNWTFYSKARLSSLLHQKEDGWKLIQQHGSLPDTRAQKGEQVAVEKISKENLELRDAIKRRTIELEQKNNELLLESSLERVRAIAMGMRKPADLLDICETMFTELHAMGFDELRNAMINIHDDAHQSFLNYDFSEDAGKTITHHFYNSHPVIEKQVKQVRSSRDAFSETVFTGKDLADWKNFRKEKGEKDDPKVDNIPALYYYFYSIGTGAIGISTYRSISAEKRLVLQKFRNVFDFAYQRYMDVALAEAQAREAQIEVALEKIRSRSLAMHKSEEIKEVVKTVVERIKELDIEMNGGVSLVTFSPDSKDLLHWIWIPEQFEEPMKAQLPYFDNIMFQDCNEGREKGLELIAKVYSGDEKRNYFTHIFNNSGFSAATNELKAWVMEQEYFGFSFAIQQHSGIFLNDYTGKYFSDETNDILIRFSKIFEQSYIRFLDLQKAEAQAREAQIEAALEKVRSHSMGMQKSEELKEVIKIVYQQLAYLKIKLDHAGFVVNYTSGGDWHFWIADEQDIPAEITHPYFESVWANQFNEAKEKGADFFATHLNFEEKNHFYNELLSYVPGLPEASKDFYLNCPGLAASTVLLDNVGLYIENFSGTPYTDEENKILMRFGYVFQQTYTRFLDLQKAEAQAREALIEAATERVRVQSMAMVHPKDLEKVNKELLHQLTRLNIDGLSGVSFYFVDADEIVTVWDLSSPGSMNDPNSYSFKYDSKKYPALGGFVEILKTTKENYFILDFPMPGLLQGIEELKEINISIADALKNAVKSGALLHQWNPAARITDGILSIDMMKPPDDDTKFILLKMAGAFDQAYIRFLDLQKAAAQAREAQIEAALERVRSKTMAMQHSEELQNAALLLFQQVETLGLPPFSCGFNIWDEDRQAATAWMGGVGGLQPPFKTDSSRDIYLPILEAAQSGESLFVIEQRGKELEIHYDYLASIPTFRDVIMPNMVKLGISFPTYQIIHCVFFSKGYLMFISYEPVPGYYEIFKRFARVFEQTYTRFLDLQKAEAQAFRAEQDLIEIKAARSKAEDALAELKVTQKQLIQSEKMASLGELTAGIAHEIQNPLNFVNNFSEVSTELVDEMNEAINNGNSAEAIEIAHDLKQNLEKINHHGKRAGDIVKGMLLHSRTSTATKEPTNINALTDEYLRLAYHGLRAKDKSFNATLKTDFDTSIGNINIIPQDIGRVLLNLINNAFYAVNEKQQAESSKQKAEGKPYEPTVSVSTKKENDKIFVAVADNGNGIPPQIFDKIFQPFFTTKPTGQGTGLGLSLSYDIVKAHGGELKVETKEGEETTFMINLPVTYA